MSSRRTWHRLRATFGSVRVRVAAAAALTFAAVLVVASVWLLHALETRLTTEARAQATTAVQDAAKRLVLDGGPIGVSAGPGVMDPAFETTATPDGVLVVAYRTAPTAAVGTAGTAVATFDVTGSTGAARAALPVDPQTAGRLGITGGGPYILATISVNDEVSLAAVSSLAEVQHTIGSMRALLWWVVPALVALVAGLSWLVVGRALRPVHAVTRQLAAIGSDSLHERVPVPPVADEVGELATTMNSMLDRLETATLTNRQLVSDASHELRTPIAVLRTELEVADLDPDVDWPVLRTTLLGEVDRLQALVDDLLLLARTTERGMQPTAVDVGDVVQEVAARRRAVPVDVQIDDDADGDGIVVDADRLALHSAVDHLVANVARHADTRVHIEVERTGAAVAVRVDDDGPGIPAADRDRVVERFVRLDEGRDRDGGGSGLGLAVAAGVARAHGGTLTIDDAPIGGARVTVTLPTPVG